MTILFSLLNIFIPLLKLWWDFKGYSKDEQQAFIKKIQSAKDDARIPIQQSDEFKKQDEELKSDDQTKP